MKEVVPFLRFDGNCRQAMEFYQQSFEAELFLLPFSAVPEGLITRVEAWKDRIMHATLSKDFTILMGADVGPDDTYQSGNGSAVMIQGSEPAEADRLFTALAKNGNVTMQLQDTFWGARFGTLTDQFSVRWMFNYTLAKQPVGREAERPGFRDA